MDEQARFLQLFDKGTQALDLLEAAFARGEVRMTNKEELHLSYSSYEGADLFNCSYGQPRYRSLESSLDLLPSSDIEWLRSLPKDSPERREWLGYFHFEHQLAIELTKDDLRYMPLMRNLLPKPGTRFHATRTDRQDFAARMAESRKVLHELRQDLANGKAAIVHRGRALLSSPIGPTQVKASLTTPWFMGGITIEWKTTD